MQIVIEIPEEDYKWVCEQNMGFELYKMIANGTQLPRGHGRLIDEKVAYRKFYARCLAGVATEVFAETPTIIEADKGDKE